MEENIRIIIIKLGALGDVVRTLSVLPAIKEKYPDSEILWLTKENALEIFEGNPYVKKVFALPIATGELGNFDILYNFDIDKEATNLVMALKAGKKYGFYSQGEYPAAFNPGAEYYLNTLFDDELKRENRKTYQEMMFSAAELQYKSQFCQIYLNEKDKRYADDFAIRNKIKIEGLIGIHLGASSRWPSKAWHEAELKRFIKKAKQIGFEILLFAGIDEAEKQERIVAEMKENGIMIYRSNPNNTLKQFASLVNLCKAIICSDSFALHVSLALKKPTIALFFCTSPYEIEGYGMLKKLISPMLSKFFPERMDEYNEELTKSISAEDVFKALKEIEKSKSAGADAVNVANAIIINKDKFLVIKRKEGIHSGKWAFPGGIVEKGENAEQALKREVKEETGLEISRIVKKISGYEYLRENGKKSLGQCFLVDVKNKNANIKPSKEIEDFKWATLEKFDSMEHVPGLEEEAMAALFGNNKNRNIIQNKNK